MSNKKLMAIFYSLFGFGVLGCILGAIIGLLANETEWGFGGVLFIFSFFVLMLGSIVFVFIMKLILHLKGNKLILKEYGTPKSKTKIYTIILLRL